MAEPGAAPPITNALPPGFITSAMLCRPLARVATQRFVSEAGTPSSCQRSASNSTPRAAAGSLAPAGEAPLGAAGRDLLAGLLPPAAPQAARMTRRTRAAAARAGTAGMGLSLSRRAHLAARGGLAQVSEVDVPR